MKTKRCWIMIICLAALAANIVNTRAQEGNRPQGGGGLPAANFAIWLLDTLDATPDHTLVKYPSIALDPFTNTPYISYYDETDGDLMMAHPVSTGGNCGPGNGWLCETVAGASSDAGRYSSIAVYNNLVIRGVGIAYMETDGQDHYMRYAHYSCNVMHPPCSDWSYEYVHLHAAMYLSLKFDSTGEPHIASYTPGYIDDPLPAINGALRYSSHTTPGDTGWTTWVVAQGATPPGGQDGENWFGVGLYPSLAINSSDNPRIAFFGSDYSNLNYAVYVGNNTGSCFDDDWDCQVIDDVEANTGMFPSLYLTNIIRRRHPPAAATRLILLITSRALAS
jgi:hypothetical protein